MDCPMISHNVMINLWSSVCWQIWQWATTFVYNQTHMKPSLLFRFWTDRMPCQCHNVSFCETILLRRQFHKGNSQPKSLPNYLSVTREVTKPLRTGQIRSPFSSWMACSLQFPKFCHNKHIWVNLTEERERKRKGKRKFHLNTALGLSSET